MGRALELSIAAGLCAWPLAHAHGEPPDTRMDTVTAPLPPGGRATPPPKIQRKPNALEPVDGAPRELGLTRQSDGAWLYKDPARRFTAKFNEDGTVYFGDRWRRPSSKNRQHGQCCALPPEGLNGANPFVGVPMTGPLEWIVRAQGKDLAAAAKTALLNQTRAFRTQLAISFNLRLLEKRLGELEPELLVIWSDHRRTLAQRKQLLFQRWDECDELFVIDPGDIPPGAITTLDEARMQTAHKARRRIERFIRRHAPASSRHAYTRADLVKLNKRRVSKQRFLPYAKRK